MGRYYEQIKQNETNLTDKLSDCQEHETSVRSHERVRRPQRVERGAEVGKGERLGVPE